MKSHPASTVTSVHYSTAAHSVIPAQPTAQGQMINMPLNTELYIVQQHNISDLEALQLYT